MENQAYRPVYQTSLVDPAEFWAEAAEAIDWVTPPTHIVDAGGIRHLTDA